jgi:dienelactone hydrolase
MAEVDGSQMSCFLTSSEKDASCPGVVVCMHAPGVDGFIQRTTRKLSEGGFVAIAPDFYRRDPAPEDGPLKRMSRLRDDQLLEDLAAATGRLRILSKVDGDRVASIGFCMGGCSAYLHATADPRLQAVVVFYGGNILVPWGNGPSPLERRGSISLSDARTFRPVRYEPEPPGCHSHRRASHAPWQGP